MTPFRFRTSASLIAVTGERATTVVDLAARLHEAPESVVFHHAVTVLEEVREEAGDHPDVHVLVLPPTANLEINALVRGSTIVLQKSVREGFGLTVAEALWKRKPVIAGAVGGIPAQVIHNVTGILVHSVEGCAYQIRSLLADPERMRLLGEYGHQRVRQEFVITSNLRRWLVLLLLLLAGHPEADVVEI